MIVATSSLLAWTILNSSLIHCLLPSQTCQRRLHIPTSTNSKIYTIRVLVSEGLD
jgi:hypothetical protein